MSQLITPTPSMQAAWTNFLDTYTDGAGNINPTASLCFDLQGKCNGYNNFNAFAANNPAVPQAYLYNVLNPVDLYISASSLDKCGCAPGEASISCIQGCFCQTGQNFYVPLYQLYKLINGTGSVITQLQKLAASGAVVPSATVIQILNTAMKAAGFKLPTVSSIPVSC